VNYYGTDTKYGILSEFSECVLEFILNTNQFAMQYGILRNFYRTKTNAEHNHNAKGVFTEPITGYIIDSDIMT
ncbi:13637_t:CDS:1, partial [Ambispora leptoticha]